MLLVVNPYFTDLAVTWLQRLAYCQASCLLFIPSIFIENNYSFISCVVLTCLFQFRDAGVVGLELVQT